MDKEKRNNDYSSTIWHSTITIKPFTSFSCVRFIRFEVQIPVFLFSSFFSSLVKMKFHTSNGKNNSFKENEIFFSLSNSNIIHKSVCVCVITFMSARGVVRVLFVNNHNGLLIVLLNYTTLKSCLLQSISFLSTSQTKDDHNKKNV